MPWNSLEIFVRHLVQTGSVMIWSFLHNGHTEHLDTMMVPVGAAGHLLLVTACLAALVCHANNHKKGGNSSGSASVLAYFFLIIAPGRNDGGV